MLLLPLLLLLVAASAAMCFGTVVEPCVAFVASLASVCDVKTMELDAVVSAKGAVAKLPTDVLITASNVSAVAVTFPVLSVTFAVVAPAAVTTAVTRVEMFLLPLPCLAELEHSSE